ncbi:MAG: hypothetical protein FIA96_10205 [Betaproteobacteria bacterium]|nr:hypothetical protein [Betaproteobacteria bacterium]
MTTETGLAQQPKTTSELRPHAGIPDWAGFLITVAILAYWLPKWMLVLLPAAPALWAAGRLGQTLDWPWIPRRPTSFAWTAIGGIGLLALFRVPPMALAGLVCLMTAVFVLAVVHHVGWPRYRTEVIALVKGKWFRAGGWLFVFIGKLFGYLFSMIAELWFVDRLTRYRWRGLL